MKFSRICVLFVVILALASFSVSAKKNKTVKPKVTQCYAFGVASSFLDSLMYITDIQVLDSAEISKDGFLTFRSEYSYQLQDYVELKLSKENFIPVIFFNLKKEKLEKEYQKLLKFYEKRSLDIQNISMGDFTFHKPENQN